MLSMVIVDCKFMHLRLHVRLDLDCQCQNINFLIIK